MRHLTEGHQIVPSWQESGLNALARLLI